MSKPTVSEIKALLVAAIKRQDEYIELSKGQSSNPVVYKMIVDAMGQRQAFQDVLDALNGDAIGLKISAGK